MAFKRQHLEEWTAKTLPGERVVSYVVTGQRGASYTQASSTGPVRTHKVGLGDDRRTALADALGLDPEEKVGYLELETFYVLTDRQLILGKRSWRNRPKELLHTAPLEAVRVHWFDHDGGAGNRYRHFVTEFGGGAWRGDRSGLTALGREVTSSNADDWVQALGERAIEAPEP